MAASADALRDEVRRRYAESAEAVADGSAGCGCGEGACCGDSDASAIGSAKFGEVLYDSEQRSELPQAAALASLGCGNPVAVADLHAGETVLDLGSGGGIDVILSARRVGPTGTAFGLDMTDEMLALALENVAEAGVMNAHFLKGVIEEIPLPANSVDVVISNCVINLSGDKDRVLQEAFRVLKPGGRFAVSDVVVRGEIPDAIRKSMELWVGCIAGALSEDDYRNKLAAAGFSAIDVEVTRVYKAEDACSFLDAAGLDIEEAAKEVDDKIVSAFVRAVKPASGCGCGC